jgi:hypothetical protein
MPARRSANAAVPTLNKEYDNVAAYRGLDGNGTIAKLATDHLTLAHAGIA